MHSKTRSHTHLKLSNLFQGAPMVVMGGAPLPGHKRKGAGEEEEQPVPLGERGDAEIEEDMDADEVSVVCCL